MLELYNFLYIPRKVLQHWLTNLGPLVEPGTAITDVLLQGMCRPLQRSFEIINPVQGVSHTEFSQWLCHVVNRSYGLETGEDGH
ncbi:hypothetical protein M5689_018176 [Euphorbia peplus]|nr:hypothetical protein M5689_018176 [Euphorbia peplus]